MTSYQTEESVNMLFTVQLTTVNFKCAFGDGCYFVLRQIPNKETVVIVRATHKHIGLTTQQMIPVDCSILVGCNRIYIKTSTITQEESHSGGTAVEIYTTVISLSTLMSQR